MAYRDPRHVEEVYTIKQVTDLTGVSSNTIRSWERRHGFPHPDRTGSNYRSYTIDDVRRIRAVRDARERGRTFDQAIHDLAPELSITTDVAVESPAAPPVADRGNQADRLRDALVSLDFGAASETLSSASWSTSIAETCFGVLLTVDRELARMVAAGALPHAIGTIARAWIDRKLLHAFDSSDPDDGRALALVLAILDGQERTLTLCHAINLSRTGYRVIWLGDGVRTADAPDLVTGLQPAIVVLAGSGSLAEAAINSLLEAMMTPEGTDWRGIVAVTEGLTIRGTGPIVLGLDANAAIDAIEAAFRENRALHLVRTT